MSVPFLAPGDVEGELDWRAMADALAEGHRRPRARIGDLFLTRGEETLQSRAAWVDGLGAASKTFTVVPGNAARGLPSVQGALLLFEEGSGRLLAVIDLGLVTRWKTAADLLLGARLLARPDARRLLVVGAGTVAGALVEAYRAGFPGIEVAVWSRTPAHAEALARRVGAAAAASLEEAVAEADIVACATLAREPLLRGVWLRPGQHVDLIGAYRADMREADDAALQAVAAVRGQLRDDARPHRRAPRSAGARGDPAGGRAGRSLRPRRRAGRPGRGGGDHALQERRRRSPRPDGRAGDPRRMDWAQVRGMIAPGWPMTSAAMAWPAARQAASVSPRRSAAR